MAPKMHGGGLGGELAELARRVAATERLARDEAERAARAGAILSLAAETLRTLAAAVEQRGGYAKGSALDKAVQQAAAISREAAN